MSGHYLIVEARFYDALADAQVAGAERALSKAGASWDRISVPGALEIPAAIAFADQIFDDRARLGHDQPVILDHRRFAERMHVAQFVVESRSHDSM